MELTIEKWLGDNQLGIDIWKNKYQHNNETLDEWFERVSGGDKEVEKLIRDKKILPGGRILSNRGLYKDNVKGCYSNCFVITPPEDNIESIFECAKKMARTFSYGGGCGIDISKLAPRGAKVNNSAKYTTGAVSFMELYSMVTGLIGQNNRRGALMITLDCKHPDLEEFLSIKSDLDKVTKANISIKITDDFMKAVINNEDWELSFTRNDTKEVIKRTINAKDFFMKFCQYNHDYAEPAMLFWDTINNYNLLDNNDEFEYAGVNPCAEEPLPSGGSCLLGSINLSAFVENPFTENASFNFPEFEHTVKTGVKMLNDILDEGLPLLPLDEQKQSGRDWRQIGLGDMLIKLGYKYGDTFSLEISNAIGSTMINSALQASALLAKDKGTYPKYNDKVLESKFFKTVANKDTKKLVEKYGLRNSQLLTCAPTGSISNLLGLSAGGIEPIFATYYNRKTETLHDGDFIYKVYSPIVKEYMDTVGITDDTNLPSYFVTAMNGIEPMGRVTMQAVWQKYIDASISSTVNLPNSATVQDVAGIYTEAWKQGLKGITIFRDGCARAGILTTETKNEDEQTQTELKRGDIVKVDTDLIGKKRKLNTGCGSLHCTAFFDKNTGELRETYLSKGSSGGCQNYMIGLSRMMSLAARGGVSVHDIVDQLSSTGVCPSYAVRSAKYKDTSKGSCCPMAVGNALTEMYEEMQNELLNFNNMFVGSINKIATTTKTKIEDVVCPECQGELISTGGCISCPSCGWSKCD